MCFFVEIHQAFMENNIGKYGAHTHLSFFQKHKLSKMPFGAVADICMLKNEILIACNVNKLDLYNHRYLHRMHINICCHSISANNVLVI